MFNALFLTVLVFLSKNKQILWMKAYSEAENVLAK